MSFKTLIFFILICCFLLTTPVLILYSQGYRIDFDSFAIVKTGGLFVKTNPKSTVISLDNGQRSETSRFLGTKFIQNLIPKEYTLEVAKAGFISWRKKIEIREKQTSEFRDILLIPLKPQDTPIVQSAETFFVNEEKNILIAFSRTKESRDITFVRIDLKNPKASDSFTFRGGLEEALSYPIAIDDVALQDRILIHSVSPQKKNAYFLVDFGIMNIEPIPITVPGAIHTIIFHPENPNFLAAHIGDTLWLVETRKYSFIPLIKNIIFFTMRNAQGFAVEKDMSTVIAFALKNPDIYPEGKTYLTNEQIFFHETLPVPYRDGKFRIFKNAETIILINNVVYLKKPQVKTWETILKGADDMRPIDEREYLIWNDNAVWLLSKEKDAPGQSFSPKLAARYQNPISHVYPFGMPAKSLIFTIGNRIEIRELSFDNQENVASFAFEAEKVFFDQKTGMLYFIREGNLLQRYLYP